MEKQIEAVPSMDVKSHNGDGAYFCSLSLRLSKATSALIGIIGLGAILGWSYDVPFLKSIFPNFIPMKVNTAFSFVLISLSLLLQQPKPYKKLYFRWPAKFLALLVFLLGAFTLIEYVYHVDLHIDQLLFIQPRDMPAYHPAGRMAPITTLAMMMIGLALMLVDVKHMIYISQTCAFIVGIFGIFVLTGFSYHAYTHYQVVSYAYAAFHTAINFILVSIAIFTARPHQGIMQLLISDTEGGALARRFLPLVLMVPVLLGYVRLLGEYNQIYDHESGTALYTIANIVIFVIVGLFLSLRLMRIDIKRKQMEEALRESEERWKFALESANQGVWDWHVPEKIIYFSHAWKTMLGYQDEEIKNEQYEFESRVHPDDLQKVWKEVNDHFAGKTPDYMCEVRFRCKDGSYKWILDRGKAIERASDGRVLRAIGTHTDISELKEKESALIEAKNNVEHSNRELEQFAYGASHDLQEPLRTMCSYVQLIALRNKDTLSRESLDYIHIVSETAQCMQALINDLLAYSRVTSKPKELVETDCGQLVKQALAQLDAQIKERQAEITCGPLPTIKADKVKLLQVFQNLINNAIKFCDHKPNVHIGAKEGPTEWTFSVADNGIGISETEKNDLFIAFKRLRPQQFPGTGIGLATCKKIIEQHHGKIWAESETGKGSTFFFTISK